MTKTILSFDFGEKRIGVAVGNTITKTAEALKIIQEKNQDEKFKAIERLIQEWQPQLLVVGLPTHPDGAEHEMTQKAKRFGNQLHGRFQKEVVWVDERYTSVSVKDGNDALAAQLILQQYLDQA
ncbi:Holliday junction resolvase RuvX [Polynucleobacter sp. 30F-ANTBAC]|jgi:putative Holliday junction resolvase|uniref:Holliday junction resolvase RuvX n=1 Tax=Polynucleobacter sp. 30F-ANTBAC TaxID=2689095 RepID=UPI001C0BBB56|nr:Holliday junction resolvase RuvX [Polynucleobacter sp. 30F-ANTBAC]MBU3599675.1 Holliday junction resolvase RuvX [Polynucleobacter sp. 30F-ANTBAC]